MGCVMLLSMSIMGRMEHWQEIKTPNNDRHTTWWTRTQPQEHY